MGLNTFELTLERVSCDAELNSERSQPNHCSAMLNKNSVDGFSLAELGEKQ